ncbi:putative yscY, partial [Vibrio parahaemolyticus V-223/04]
LNLLIQV